MVSNLGSRGFQCPCSWTPLQHFCHEQHLAPPVPHISAITTCSIGSNGRGLNALQGMPVNTNLKVHCPPREGTGKPILQVNKINLDSDSQGGRYWFFILSGKATCRNLWDNLFKLEWVIYLYGCLDGHGCHISLCPFDWNLYYWFEPCMFLYEVKCFNM